MAPKAKVTKENVPVVVEEKYVPVFELCVEKSWRAHSAKKVSEFRVAWKEQGTFGTTLLSSVKVLPTTNCDGYHYMDDGASTVLALQDLKLDWEADAEDGELSENLVEVFEKGLKVDV